jgi:hypothetical protein
VKGYEHKIDRDLEDQERHVIPIHFLGVWDTVGALGVPLEVIRWMIRKRIEFHDTELAPNVTYAYHALAIHEYRRDFPPTLWTVTRSGQTVEQVWFPGAHSDVGGGLSETGLSDVTLLWMAERAMRIGLGMNLNYLSNTRPDPLVPVTNSRTGQYRLRPRYVRPIGPKYCDEFKRQSVKEYRHTTVSYRLARISPNIVKNRRGHEVDADDRSEDPGLPVAP